MIRVLIVDYYDSFTFNLAQAFGSLGAEVVVQRNDAIDVARVSASPPAALVVSPGPGRAQTAGCSLALISVLSGRVPILGVCLGHQAISEAFGGSTIRAPQVVHGKVASINHDGGPLFSDVPSPFVATRYHSLVVDEPSVARLPLRVIARTSEGLLMALRHRDHPTFGVQFHPESVLTPHGPRILANFLTLAETM